ncbi:hypothetical protein VNO80_28124 [Phaseolus coccineus]|uniref:ABC transporter domain-containing protein n=1 Tax=Phaseolus coccineus TaxID=3886 RepID=A0AAN9QIF7_PHACN
MDGDIYRASNSLRARSSTVWRNSGVEAFSRSSREEDDEEALKWAALEKLPTYNRLRKGLLTASHGVANEIDVSDLGFQQKQKLLERLVKVAEEDNERFLLKLRERIDRVGLDIPTIEVRYEHLNIDAEAFAGSRALPSFINSVTNVIEVSGKVTYNGHELNEFVPQRTAAYISQHDVHIGEMTVRETLAFSARCQGVGSRYDMLSELSRREKAANIKPDPDLDVYMKATATAGQESSIVTDYTMKVMLKQAFDKPQASITEETPEANTPNEGTVAEVELPHRESSGRGGSVVESGHGKKKGMVLPFEPHSITFDEVVYSVDMPQEMKEQGLQEDRLVLLKGVSGAFRPGVLTALMGMFIEEVMELVELNPLRNSLVGLPGVSGLSTEQRKRLTIAVELVANPSIIFMDEPTSGLDARAAAIVMRTVRNTVDTGRTVVCTIHQPSIDIFEAFDESIDGVSKIKDGYNPATWMLEVTTTAQELSLGVDFTDLYRNSDLYSSTRGDLMNAIGSMYTAVLFLGVQNSSSVQPVVAVERTVFYREKAARMYSALPYAFSQMVHDAWHFPE